MYLRGETSLTPIFQVVSDLSHFFRLIWPGHKFGAAIRLSDIGRAVMDKLEPADSIPVIGTGTGLTDITVVNSSIFRSGFTLCICA